MRPAAAPHATYLQFKGLENSPYPTHTRPLPPPLPHSNSNPPTGPLMPPCPPQELLLSYNIGIDVETREKEMNQRAANLVGLAIPPKAE